MAETSGAPWRPLAVCGFARLYLVYLLCFLSASIVEATAAWNLADQGAQEWLVALVSTTATLPIVFLILPFGALADTGRKHGLLRGAQWVSTLSALGLAILAFHSWLAPQWLLSAVALSGLAMAMRLPSLTATVPETLPAQSLPDGMTLLGVATSLTRFAGPALAAAAIAYLGAPSPYLLAAILAGAALGLLRGFPVPEPDRTLPAERIAGAIRLAVQFAAQSPEFRRLLLRGALFFFVGAAAQALAPLAASRSFGGGAIIFMSVIGAAGLGALSAGLALPYLRARLRRTDVARLSLAIMGAGAAFVAFAPAVHFALAGSFLHGAGWIAGLATFTSLAQQSLPDWVRARGMALTHAALIGGVAIGAAFWGQVASLAGLAATLGAAAFGCVLLAAYRPWLMLLAPAQRELSPKRYWSEPALAIPVLPEDGPALVQVEYRIKEGAADAFLATLKKSRQLRLRSGALSWSLFRDLEDRHRFTEQILYENWSDRLRQAHRTTEADAFVREKKLTMLIDGEAPRIAQWVAVKV